MSEPVHQHQEKVPGRLGDLGAQHWVVLSLLPTKWAGYQMGTFMPAGRACVITVGPSLGNGLPRGCLPGAAYSVGQGGLQSPSDGMSIWA